MPPPFFISVAPEYSIPSLAECVTGSASELTGRRLDLSPAFISCWPLPFRRLLHLTSMGNIQIAGSFP